MSLLRRSLSRAFSTSVATRSNVNKAILVGNVGSDCEVKQISEEKTVTTYSLATSEMRKDKEGNTIKQTQWHRIVGWNIRPHTTDKIKKG
ncbi:hypothetical protein BC936DRAFT_137614 [Jimgerdemannia flammicorona]|uniref:Uncharacterized protein n=1 Tax=Jimgerdemannia flammicorona TaxID=994334 RepID=A0A433DIY4_9FUNG|nr:hypothetical protein BC936DRAFT_137614 [Jimgerdemannia flammicorona]